MIRPLHPTDMPSYLAFVRNACYGEGVERCPDGLVPLRFLGLLGRSLALDAPRQTWVYTRDREILGLAAVNGRRDGAVWEIDRWVGTGLPEAERALQSLLEHLACVGGEEGIQKIFLRLPSESPLLAVARKAGFVAYCTERVYRGNARSTHREKAPFRPRRGTDSHALFMHYTHTVPGRVRQVEALTMQEWRWLDGWKPRRHWRLGVALGHRDFVWESEGQILAWIRVEGRRRILYASVDHRLLGEAEIESAVDYALAGVRSASTVYCPVRDYQDVLERVFARNSFEPAGEYVLMVQHLTVRVGERILVPAGA